MNYKTKKDKDGFYIILVKYWFLPFWIEYGIYSFTHYSDAINHINFLYSLKRKRKVY